MEPISETTETEEYHSAREELGSKKSSLTRPSEQQMSEDEVQSLLSDLPKKLASTSSPVASGFGSSHQPLAINVQYLGTSSAPSTPGQPYYPRALSDTDSPQIGTPLARSPGANTIIFNPSTPSPGGFNMVSSMNNSLTGSTLQQVTGSKSYNQSTHSVMSSKSLKSRVLGGDLGAAKKCVIETSSTNQPRLIEGIYKGEMVNGGCRTALPGNMPEAYTVEQLMEQLKVLKTEPCFLRQSAAAQKALDEAPFGSDMRCEVRATHNRQIKTSVAHIKLPIYGPLTPERIMQHQVALTRHLAEVTVGTEDPCNFYICFSHCAV